MAGTKNDIRISQSCRYQLNEIKVPTLVVHGRDDELLPFETNGQTLANSIPSARLFIAEKGGHSCIFTHNKDIREVVKDFLNRN